MQVQINTDHNIEGHEALAAQMSAVVENALSRCGRVSTPGSDAACGAEPGTARRQCD
jgi:hypothetical protein